jgi:hypothetical protein
MLATAVVSPWVAVIAVSAMLLLPGRPVAAVMATIALVPAMARWLVTTVMLAIALVAPAILPLVTTVIARRVVGVATLLITVAVPTVIAAIVFVVIDAGGGITLVIAHAGAGITVVTTVHGATAEAQGQNCKNKD